MTRIFRNIILALAVALLPVTAQADDKITLFSALSSSGTYGCTGLNSAPCDLAGFSQASFQVTSVSTSVATVAFQLRNTPTDPWATVFTVTNPSVGELGYNGPGVGQCQVVVTWGSGSALTATLSRIR